MFISIVCDIYHAEYKAMEKKHQTGLNRIKPNIKFNILWTLILF